MLSSYKERILKAKDARSVPMCIVGTQSTCCSRLLSSPEDCSQLWTFPVDQEDRREVLTSDGKKLAFEWKAAFMEASSESGENVEKAFELRIPLCHVRSSTKRNESNTSAVVQEILNFGKEKEEARTTRAERERMYQEKIKAEKQATMSGSEQQEQNALSTGKPQVTVLIAYSLKKEKY